MGTPYEVTSVLSGKSGQSPILVDFENAKINPALSEPLKCKLFKDCDDLQRKYVTIENEKVTYIGCPDNTNNTHDTYLAVCNRETHKVQLISVESVRATAAVGRQFQPSRLKSEGLSKNAVLDLSRQFGSKVSKRLQEQTLRFHLVAKSDAHLKEVVQGKVISTDDLHGTSDDSILTLLPPCNTTTSSPSEIYNLNDILNEEERMSLQEGFKAKEVEEEAAFIKKCSPLFNSLLSSCMKDSNRMAFLIYAEYLIRLCNKKRFRSFAEICDCSEEVAKRMSTDFLVKRGSERILPSANLDKAILRIIIIALHLSKFKIELLSLANSLRYVNTNRIRLLVRMTGAIFPSAIANVANLRAPVSLYSVNAKQHSKKRKR